MTRDDRFVIGWAEDRIWGGLGSSQAIKPFLKERIKEVVTIDKEGKYSPTIYKLVPYAIVKKGIIEVI